MQMTQPTFQTITLPSPKIDVGLSCENHKVGIRKIKIKTTTTKKTTPKQKIIISGESERMRRRGRHGSLASYEHKV